MVHAREIAILNFRVRILLQRKSNEKNKRESDSRFLFIYYAMIRIVIILFNMKKIKISSKDNEKIKNLKKLNQKKYREKLGQFFIENIKIAFDAAKQNILPQAIFITEEFEERNKKELDFVLKKSKLDEYYLIDEKINKRFSNLDTPSGFAAVYERLNTKIDYSKPIIYLNGINDPGNLGTILRSALAFNMKNVVLDSDCADLYNFKTLNAAKDSFFKLNIEFDKANKILKNIKKQMPIYSTRLKGGEEPKSLKKQKLFCVVLGSEAHGVDQKIQKMSDGFIKIKMSDEIESLNVATAAAIIFYELYK